MFKKTLSLLLTSVMAFCMFTACSKDSSDNSSAADDVTVRIGSLSGPTTIGLVNLKDASDNNDSKGKYEFTIAVEPQEIAASLNSGDIDIALIPANLAATLYSKTGNISVIDINTLGVLYCITADESIDSIEDLSEKTVVTTGQGATPEATLRYLLAQYGIDDCTLDFRSEGTEVVSVIVNDPDTIAVLPQPAATAAGIQNDSIKTAFSLEDEWGDLGNGSSIVTGVTVVRNDFLKEHPEAVKTFIEEHKESAKKALEDVDTTAALVVEAGIVPKEPIAKKAIPLCNIVCIDGEEMKTLLSGYLEALESENPQLVGGSVPDAAFYYLG